MLRTSLLAAFAFATPLLAQDYEVAADVNTDGQTAYSGFTGTLPISGSTALGGGVLLTGTTLTLGKELYRAGIDQPATLVLDINPGAEWSDPIPGVVHDGKAYFRAFHEDYGDEMWVSDGTGSGTHLWFDYAPLEASSYATPILAVPGGFVFTKEEAGGQRNLYFTDGTPGVASNLTNFGPDEGSTNNWPMHLLPTGELLFVAQSTGSGNELWTTGVQPGTAKQLIEIAPGTSNVTLDQAHTFGGFTYLVINNLSAIQSHELWVTDGTTSGTKYLTYLGNVFADVGNLTEFNGRLYWTANTLAEGGELWSTDGTKNGVRLETDINPPSVMQTPVDLAVLGDKLFFGLAYDSATAQDELWMLGTTPMSEQIVHDIHPSGPSRPRDLTVDAGRVYFAATDPVNGREVWSSDGTAAGTHLEADLAPGSASSEPYFKGAVPGGIFFTADTPATGRELFQIAGGAVSLNTDLETKLTNAGSYPRETTVLFGQDVYFGALGTFSALVEPFALLGGAQLETLGDLYPGGSSNPADFTGVVQGGAKRVFFTASSSFQPRDLWVTDGTAAGTSALGLVNTKIKTDARNLVGFRDGLFFVADSLANQAELWHTDGTFAGTTQVTTSGPNGGSNPGDLVACGDFLYFTAIDANGFRNVFRTAFDSGGPTLEQISAQSYHPTHGTQQLANVRGRLVYVELDPGNARMVVHDPVTNTEVKYVQGLNFGIPYNQMFDPVNAPTVRGSRYYTFAVDQSLGNGYRSFDIVTGATVPLGATTGGTVLPPNKGHSLRFIGGQGYFVGEGPQGVELYRLDNAPLSTQLVYNATASGSSTPSELVAAGNDLYFYMLETDIDEQEDDLLTTSGGLVSTACEFTDPVGPGGRPTDLALAGGYLYFSATLLEGVGRELLRRPNLGAHVVDFGTNASGGVLDVDIPLLNTSVGVYVRNQAPGTVTTLWTSAVTGVPTAGLAIPGDTLWLDPTTAQFAGATTNVELLKAIPVPALASLIEAQFTVQAVMIDPLNPTALRTTNAKLVTLGF